MSCGCPCHKPDSFGTCEECCDGGPGIAQLRAKLARVEAVFGELFDKQVGGEKLTAEDAIEAFRLALIEAALKDTP